ncbi:MAG: RNA methyltransferase [Bacteroidales bacterium]|jgi:TrmH family RNA methyltransferase|nr:RNA methyltransferase [Bacteroidales bacterium]
MISSVHNSRIRHVLKLDKAHERRCRGLFVVEGVRELSLAVAGGYVLQEALVCMELLDAEGKALLESLAVPTEQVALPVFERLAYRGKSGGIIALAASHALRPDDIRPSDHPLVIVLEAVEKPGNLGAVLRTADAVDADAVIVCDPQTDLYNPNVIRSSLGCLFTRQVAVCTSQEALQWLRRHNILIHAADPAAAGRYHQADFTAPAAIVLGTEADGLTDFWLRNADRRIAIPMRGRADSLNVSVAAAVMVFEAVRQRAEAVGSADKGVRV